MVYAQSPHQDSGFRGLDSSRILILKGGILMSIGNFPASLSQAIVAGRCLVGAAQAPLRCHGTRMYVYIYIYIYIYIHIYIYIYIFNTHVCVQAPLRSHGTRAGRALTHCSCLGGNQTRVTPGLHNKIPAHKIFARVWVAQEPICSQVVAKILAQTRVCRNNTFMSLVQL